MIIDKAEVIVTSPDRHFVTVKITTSDGVAPSPTRLSTRRDAAERHSC